MLVLLLKAVGLISSGYSHWVLASERQSHPENKPHRSKQLLLSQVARWRQQAWDLAVQHTEQCNHNISIISQTYQKIRGQACRNRVHELLQSSARPQVSVSVINLKAFKGVLLSVRLIYVLPFVSKLQNHKNHNTLTSALCLKCKKCQRKMSKK